MALENILKLYGVKSDCAYNGRDAIQKIVKSNDERCGANCQKFHVVFMDCSMPVMDGFESTRQLKRRIKGQELQSITVIGCTAFTTEQKIQECLNSGMDVVLSKPLNSTKVQEIVKKYLKKK